MLQLDTVQLFGIVTLVSVFWMGVFLVGAFFFDSKRARQKSKMTYNGHQ